MATLIWTEPAVADLEEIGQFISKDNPLAAEKVGSRIIREAENVAAFPRLGRIVPEFGNPELREIISQSLLPVDKLVNDRLRMAAACSVGLSQRAEQNRTQKQ